jgi:hypothetical protein
LTPGWPDDPETVEEAKAHPEVFAGKSIGQVADHFEGIIRGLERKPAVGWLLTQILAGRGLAAVSVAIDPAPFRGVLPLPISALKSATVAPRCHTAAASRPQGPLDLVALPTLKVYDEDRSCRRQLNTDRGAAVASSDHRRSVSGLSRRRASGPQPQ